MGGTRIKAGTAVLLGAILGGCSVAPYQRIPLDADAATRRFDERSLASFAPPAPGHWDLAALTEAALFHQPDIAVAKARQTVAERTWNAAAMGGPTSGAIRAEHHSDTTGKSSAWTYGAELDLPLTGSGRRDARREAAAAERRAADIEVDAASWRTRAEVRRRFVELYGARAAHASRHAEAAARRELAALLQKRLELGAADGVEAGEAQRALAEAEAGELATASAEAVALAALARAVGVPTGELARIDVSFAELETPPPPADDPTLRDRALHARADLRRALADYDAAEAAVKLEVARQYPELSLRPGYAWDQGDRRWSFALGWLTLPSANRTAVAEAEAKRELAARQFLALQAQAIGDIATAQRRYEGARLALAQTDALREAADRQDERTARSFAAGAVDRAGRAAASLAKIAAERAAAQARVAAQLAAGELEAALQQALQARPALALGDAARPAP